MPAEVPRKVCPFGPATEKYSVFDIRYLLDGTQLELLYIIVTHPF